MKIAFIGLGNMGLPMALNLQKAEFAITGFDLSASACEQSREQGINIATSIDTAVENADFIISMLPTGKHVEDLYIGKAEKNGILAKIKKGALVIDSSTIAAVSSQLVAKEAEKYAISFIDAPVSGGVGGATAATLSFMVGGLEQDFERAKPLMQAMGKNIFHVGTFGMGQTAKICNNMMLGISMLGTCEALELGIANGLDAKLLSEIMRKSSGGSWVLEVYNPIPGIQENSVASKGYIGGFGTDLILKDLGLALESAILAKSSTPMGALARSLYAAHSLSGAGHLDFSSIIKMIQKK